VEPTPYFCATTHFPFGGRSQNLYWLAHPVCCGVNVTVAPTTCGEATLGCSPETTQPPAAWIQYVVRNQLW